MVTSPVFKLSRNAPERHTGTFWKGGTPYRNFWRRLRRNARLAFRRGVLQRLQLWEWTTAVFNETEIKQIVAISVLLAATKVTKFVFGSRWGSSWCSLRTPSRSNFKRCVEFVFRFSPILLKCSWRVLALSRRSYRRNWKVGRDIYCIHTK